MRPLPSKVVMTVKQNRFLFNTVGKAYYYGFLGVKELLFDVGTAIKRVFPDNDVKAIRALKGTCSGRCFIIGNGPSLKAEDLDRIKEQRIPSFSSNNIDAIFERTDWRPDYYVCQDKNGLKTQEHHKVALTYHFGTYFFAKDAKKIVEECELTKQENVLYFRADVSNMTRDPNKCSPDASLRVASGFTVTYAAIQLAMYLGYEEIYLLGVDCSYPKIADRNGLRIEYDGPSHFDGCAQNETVSYGYANVEGMMQAYRNAKKYADEHGIKIYNATRGGKLEVFERVGLSKVIGGGITYLLDIVHLTSDGRVRGAAA